MSGGAPEERILSFRGHAARRAIVAAGGSLLIGAGLEDGMFALRPELSPITVGRRRAADETIVLRGIAVSRDHALLQCFGGRWVLEDHSRHGTMVERATWPRAHRVNNERHSLLHGDRLLFGDASPVRFESFDPPLAGADASLGATATVAVGSSRDGWDLLSREERALVIAMIDGQRSSGGAIPSTEALAQTLHKSPNTIKNQLGSIFRKWGCTERAAVVHRAIELL